MTQVIKQEEAQPLAVWQAEEWADDGTSSIAPSFPIIKIVQPTSTMEGSSKHQGQFHRSDTGEFYGPLDLVALFQKSTRAYFVEGNDQPACMSTDGFAPRPNMPLWKGKTEPYACTDCPFSQWGEDGSPPPCSASFVVLVDHNAELAQVRIGGKSIKPWKRFISQKLAPRKLPLCSQRLHLYTEERSEPGKKWFELRIDNTQLTVDEAKKYNAILAYERQRFETAVEEAHEANEEAEPVVDAWESA